MKNIIRIFNIIIAILVQPYYRIKLKNTNIILVGGHEGRLFEDNGKRMYQYLSNNKKYLVYWVIDKECYTNSIQGNYVFRGSVLNYNLYFCSLSSLYSHSISDVLPILHRFYNKRKAVHIFLGHGPDGLKTQKKIVQNNLIKNKLLPTPNIPYADYYISISEFEKNIKNEYWNIQENKIKITGLPRFDTLQNHLGKFKQILYMPTWRDCFFNMSNEEIKKSTFYNSLKELLKNERLNSFLRLNNIKLNLYLHQYLVGFLKDDFKELSTNQNISILEGKQDLQDLINTSDVMITDYSSVSWDFMYLHKPIVFFQPDQEQYLSERGSYIDFNNEFFGPVTFTVDITIDYLLNMLTDNAYRNIVDNNQEMARKKYFKFIDQNNSKRVLEIIEDYLEKQ